MNTAAPTTDKKDVVPSTYRDKYKSTGGTCGDFIATRLQKVAKDGIEGLNTIKAENGIEADRWATFNPGMQRMNLANVLRGKFLNGETITIHGQQYNAKHTVENDFNGTLADDDKTLLRVADLLDLQMNDRTVAALRKLFFAPAKAAPVDREAKRLAKAAEKEAGKAVKAAEKTLAAAQKAEKKANEALDKATTAEDEAKAAAQTAADAVKNADEAGKAAAEKASIKANEKVGKAEDKVEELAKKADAATAATKTAQAALDALNAAE